jgi:hypothetical protein
LDCRGRWMSVCPELETTDDDMFASILNL